jgi:hypothetical protein
MNTWNARDARSCFGEVMKRALAGEPQRVSGDRPMSVVVLSETEYERLCGRGSEAGRGPRPSLVEFMRNSPLAAAIRDGDLPEDVFDQIRKDMWGHMDPVEPSEAAFRSGAAD